MPAQPGDGGASAATALPAMRAAQPSAAAKRVGRGKSAPRGGVQRDVAENASRSGNLPYPGIGSSDSSPNAASSASSSSGSPSSSSRAQRLAASSSSASSGSRANL